MIKVTYTCFLKEQKLNKIPKENISHLATLSLDSQTALLPHWGSCPYKINIAGPDAEAMKLGDKYSLTVEKIND